MRSFGFSLKKLYRNIGTGVLIVVILAGLLMPSTTIFASTKGVYYIKINRQQNCITIYKKDSSGDYTVPVKAMACSTGVNGATPLGKFSIGEKYRWHELDGSVYGQYCSRITGHILFHSVYYHSTDPGTLYYNEYNKLGSTASHGCVRLSVADAKWIYDNCAYGTVVEIYDSSDPGPLGKPNTVKIDTSSKYRGWDPTDPDSGNPWKTVKPSISGAVSRTVERGSTVNLTKGVTATDYKGTTLKVKVSGKCNADKAGTYKITYTATDSNGLVGRKTVSITVKDTKKPKIKISRKKIVITGEISEKKMEKILKANVTATDSGETLSSKYIYVKYGKLSKAMQKNKYGTYTVTVYAKDKAGNKSVKRTFMVIYENPNPQTDESDTEVSELEDSDAENQDSGSADADMGTDVDVSDSQDVNSEGTGIEQPDTENVDADLESSDIANTNEEKL